MVLNIIMSYYNDGLREINGLRLLGVHYFQSFMNNDIIMFVLFISFYPLQREKRYFLSNQTNSKAYKSLKQDI